jgi:hypothetical protein
MFLEELSTFTKVESPVKRELVAEAVLKIKVANFWVIQFDGSQ